MVPSVGSTSALCHLDPDVDRNRKPRPEGWRGASGQVSAARTHLLRKEVGKGDLFLFFGLFRDTANVDGVLKPIGPRKHLVWGWLQADQIVELEPGDRRALDELPWLKEHPHGLEGWGAGNSVFVGAEQLRIGKGNLGLPGYGAFKKGFPLTDPASPLASVWSVPNWLNPVKGGVGMSYHRSPSAWREGGVKSAGRGQEFVADIAGRDDAQEWLLQLIEGHA
jgi:hypothetical protein